MKKRVWLAGPILAIALMVSPVLAEEQVAQPSVAQMQFIQNQAFVPVQQGQHIFVENMEADRHVSSTSQNAISVQAFSDAIYEAASNFEEVIQVKLTVTPTEQILRTAVLNGLGKGEYTYGNGISTSFGMSSDGTVTVRFSYRISEAKEQAITKYVEDIAAEIFTNDMTDFEKVHAAYRYIILNTNYSVAPQADGGGHSIYSILKDGIGVCQAYALLFQRLMDEAGVTSKYITGITAQNVSHAWNVVTIDGKTYHVDVTYGDPVFARQLVNFDANGRGTVDTSVSRQEVNMPQYVSYGTFLLTEQQITSTVGHRITEQRPYTKPNTDTYSKWHVMENAVTLDGKHYYYQNVGTQELEMVDVTAPTLTPKTFRIDNYINRANHLVVFNDRILFSNIYGQLSQIKKDGTVSVINSGYRPGYNSLHAVGYIEVTNDRVNVYKLDAVQTGNYYSSVYYYSKKELMYTEMATNPVQPEPPVEPPIEPEPEPEPPTPEEQVNELFKPNSPTVQAINNAMTKAAFEELLNSLRQFINTPSTNAEFVKFKQKVAGFEAVKEMEQQASKWHKEFGVVAQQKTWTIEFSAPLLSSEVTKLEVVDIFNNALRVQSRLDTSGKILTITPQERYKEGAEYYVVIPAGTKSASAGTLDKAVYVPFKFE